jgi:hypothetical protein
LIKGFYKSSKNVNQKSTDEDDAFSDYEDDMDIAMIDQNSFSSTDQT